MALFGSRDENRIATLVDKLQENGRVSKRGRSRMP